MKTRKKKEKREEIKVGIMRFFVVSLALQVRTLATPGQQRRSLLGMLDHDMGIWSVENWLGKRLQMYGERGLPEDDGQRFVRVEHQRTIKERAEEEVAKAAQAKFGKSKVHRE